MIRKPKTTGFWIGRLPHWEVENGRYFITIHLSGAIPESGRQRLKILSEQVRAFKSEQQPGCLRLQRAIFREMEKWLDRAQPNSKLQHPQIAELVIEAIEHRRRHFRWEIFEYVVMPTHLHLFGEVGGACLKDAVEDFKRWTGHRAVETLSGDAERFWQREWFDHWSRSDEEDEKFVRYIRNNPVKAGLVDEYGDWPYASWNR